MSPPVYCPRCGSVLAAKVDGGRERPACLADGCGFLHFGESSIGCGGIVIRDGKALLIQRGLNPGRGTWQIPGGYVEDDESIPDAVEREVLEEAGVVARVREVVGFRHSASTPGRPNANLYVVFRLDLVSGEPRSDGVETLGADFFSLAELGEKEGMQALSVWAIKLALSGDHGSGFVSHHESFDLRPGWSVFGLPPKGVSS